MFFDDSLFDLVPTAGFARVPKGPKVRRILFNDPATVVFWEDGTKTVVKVTDGDKYVPYYGFLAALAKKVYGSNTRVQEMIRPWLPEEPAKPETPVPKKSLYETGKLAKEPPVWRDELCKEPGKLFKGDTDGDKEVGDLLKVLGLLTFLNDLSEEKHA